jgi:hypothetical protein
MTPLRMLVDGWTYDVNLALVLFPGLMAAGCLGLPAAWRALGRRRSRGVALVSTAGLLVAYAFVVAGIFVVAYPVSFGEVSGLWMLAVAGGYGLLASAIGRLWPAPQDPGPGAPDEADQDDDVWTRRLAAELRRRGDFTEARVRTVVAEAVAHVADSGGSLSDEFGPAEAYASRFAPDVVARQRRTAWGWSLLALVPAALFVTYVARDGWAWQNQFVGTAVWFGAATIMAAVSWRRYAVAAERSGARSPVSVGSTG